MPVYRDGDLALDQLMAFAITEDHARQEAVYETATRAPPRIAARSLSVQKFTRRPVNSTTAHPPKLSSTPVGIASRSSPAVVMFSPRSLGETEKPRVSIASKSSRGSKCSWRRFGARGLLRAR